MIVRWGKTYLGHLTADITNKYQRHLMSRSTPTSSRHHFDPSSTHQPNSTKIVWNTRETGDINLNFYKLNNFLTVFLFCKKTSLNLPLFVKRETERTFPVGDKTCQNPKKLFFFQLHPVPPNCKVTFQKHFFRPILFRPQSRDKFKFLFLTWKTFLNYEFIFWQSFIISAGD